MADEHPKDWSEKVQNLAKQGRELASKGIQETVKTSRDVAEKSKDIASKGLDNTIKVSKNVAKKGKDFASKSVENTKSIAQSVQTSAQQHMEQRRNRKEENSNVSEGQDSELKFTESASLDEHFLDESKLTVHDLKLRLKFLGLAVNGKKNALVERLRSARERNTVDTKSSVRHDLEQRISLIEEEYPEVLKPLPPSNDFKISRFTTNLTYTVCGLVLVVYSFLIVLFSHLSVVPSSLQFNSPVVELILPSYTKNVQFSSLDPNFDILFVLLGFVAVFLSGILLTFGKNVGANILLGYFLGIAFIGRLVFSFMANLELEPVDYRNILNDVVVFSTLCIFANIPRLISTRIQPYKDSIVSKTDPTRIIPADNPNTDAHLEHIIQEGFDMDFRAEVAKPKPPRARAKFEAYEKILLSVSFLLWPFTIFMTMAYDGGLVAFTEYSSDLIQVVSVWSLSLLTLISLVRFDRSARGNGWYAKEKETYVGMMDLYSKAQAKHYEYVELRAAAEAQEILEKYPQLDTSKSGAASKA